MDKEKILIAIIAASPILITTLTTLIINGILESRKINTSTAIENITKNRINWLAILREEVAEYISSINKFNNLSVITISKMFGDNYNSNKSEELANILADSIQDLTKKKITLILRLNPVDDKKNIEIINELFDLSLKNPFDRTLIFEKSKSLEINMHETLKNEWEKVKTESDYDLLIQKRLKKRKPYNNKLK